MTDDSMVEIRRKGKVLLLSKHDALLFPNRLNAWLVARFWRKHGLTVEQKGRFVWLMKP